MRLGLRNRRTRTHEPTPYVLAARSRARRVEFDQRDGLQPRQSRRPRPLRRACFDGWSYDDILPYYKKSENNERGASEFHGVGGELNVADLRCVNPLTHRFVEAGQDAGLKYNGDFNGASQEGVGYLQVTQKNGKRHSAAAAFLKPALSRPNLAVETGAHVTRLLFDKNKVVGVEFVQDGRTEQARVNREVILSGGAINSPQTLMLSGVRSEE